MDDYISREAVINITAETGAWETQNRVRELPSADVQPVKHGRWIFQNRNDEDGRYIYHCSECDFEVKVFPCNFLPWVMHEKYCPGCGARMDGDNNG